MQLGGIHVIAVVWVGPGSPQLSSGLHGPHHPCHRYWFGDGPLAQMQGNFTKGLWDLEVTR